MGAAIDTGGKGSVNVELNIVPFIDLMSCLTAFLLVTAVWVNIANVQNEPVTSGPSNVPVTEHQRLTVLLQQDQILVQSLPSGDARQVPAFDWPKLEEALRAFHSADDVPTVEVAAESTSAHPIAYQQLVAAMDTVVRAGYPHVGVADPMNLR